MADDLQWADSAKTTHEKLRRMQEEIRRLAREVQRLSNGVENDRRAPDWKGGGSGANRWH